MLYILKYEIKGYSLTKHLQVKTAIEKLFIGQQIHIMPTTFLIKSMYSPTYIHRVLETVLNIYKIELDACEIFVAQLYANRTRMKYKLDKKAEAWITANIDSAQVLLLSPTNSNIQKAVIRILSKTD